MSDRGLWLYCCAALLCASACKVFESTCDEDDRSCLGGGLGRSGETCVRSGDCATGMECRADVCVYTATTQRGGKCVASAECEAGMYCSSELRCSPLVERPRAAGAACSSSADCGRGLACDVDLAQVMASGAYAQLDESCRSRVTDLESDKRCLLPRTCTARGNKDFSAKCTSNAECLPGLYCVDSPISAGEQTMCLGGVELPVEPITLPTWRGAACPNDVATPTAYFEVPGAREAQSDFYRLPYPNDVRRSNRQIDLGDHAGPPPDLEPPVPSRFLSDAAAQDGFSTNPVVFFRFSSAFATNNLSLATVRIVDITASSPDYSEPASIAWGPPGRESRYICDHWLSLYRPLGSPLRPNTTYAAIVTRALRSKQGDAYERGADFDAMLAKTKPSDAALAAAWDAYAPLRAWLADSKSGVAADDLLNAAVFTTADPTSVATKLRAAVQADGRPVVKSLQTCSAGASSPCGPCQTPTAGVRELHGKLSLPVFQIGAAPYLEPQDGGELAFDGAGRPRVVRHEEVCFALSLPEAAAREAGYPLLVYAHALGGVFNEAMRGDGLAVELARSSAHAAVLAIELPQHGARRGTTERAPEDLLVNLLNPAAIRGNVLQGAADLWGAIALAQAGIPAERAPGGAAIRFDASRLALFGQGQGGAHAAIALAVDDRVRTVVLANVAGHFATQLQRVKPAPLGALMPLLLADYDDELRLPGSLTNPMLAHMQGSLDAADPINYAARLYRDSIPGGRDVFLVYGREDHFSPDPALEAYAKAARMQAVAPDLSMHFDDLPAPVQRNVSVGDQRRTVALRQYDPSDDPVTPGEPRDGHFVVQSSKAARADVVRFLTQALSGDVPSIGL